MSSHYECGDARAGLYQILSRDSAPKEWNLRVTASHALGVFNASGDGTVLEGAPAEILDYVDLLHAYTHRELDDLVDYDTRACAACGDQVLTLSSGGWCDACETVSIPGEVWRTFLAQETTLDEEHPGAVSLSAVVGELLRMVAEHQQADDATAP